jgi:hypothetical protein
MPWTVSCNWQAFTSAETSAALKRRQFATKDLTKNAPANWPGRFLMQPFGAGGVGLSPGNARTALSLGSAQDTLAPQFRQPLDEQCPSQPRFCVP